VRADLHPMQQSCWDYTSPSAATAARPIMAAVAKVKQYERGREITDGEPRRAA